MNTSLLAGVRDRLYVFVVQVATTNYGFGVHILPDKLLEPSVHSAGGHGVPATTNVLNELLDPNVMTIWF